MTVRASTGRKDGVCSPEGEDRGRLRAPDTGSGIAKVSIERCQSSERSELGQSPRTAFAESAIGSHLTQFRPFSIQFIYGNLADDSGIVNRTGKILTSPCVCG